MTELRARVLNDAKNWLDTPYQHQASQCGAGTDCLGFVRGIYRGLYGKEPQTIPPYTPDWAEQCGEETLLNAARIWLCPISNPLVQPGDVLLFRMTPQSPCKHIAILTAPDIITHAYWGRAVVESHFVPYWKRRWVHSFAFPQAPLS